MTRIEARETLMQILFELDTTKAIHEEDAISKGTEIINDRMSGNHISRCSALLSNIISDLDNIDNTINESSAKWKTSRMPKVDLAIMRLAVGEMKYSDDTPDAVDRKSVV